MLTEGNGFLRGARCEGERRSGAVRVSDGSNVVTGDHSYGSSFGAYLKDLGRIPNLEEEETEEQFAELLKIREEYFDKEREVSADPSNLKAIEAFRQVTVRFSKIRNEIVIQNLRFVIAAVKRVGFRGKLQIEDLIQEGNMALDQALWKFDPAKGRFSTYARWWIRSTVQRAVMGQGLMIRLPAYVHTINAAVWRVQNVMGSEYKEGKEEWAQRLGVTETEFDRMESSANSMHVSSLDAPLGDGSLVTQKDRVEDTGLSSDMALYQKQLAVLVRKILDQVDPPRSRAIVQCRMDGETLQEIGHRLGLTRERVRQIEEKAHLQLWKIVQKMGITRDDL